MTAPASTTSPPPLPPARSGADALPPLPPTSRATAAAAPLPPVASPAPALGTVSLGFDGSRASRPGAGPSNDLRASGRVLPELEQDAQKARSIWRHPAFIVSVVTTVLAIAAAAAFVVMGMLGDKPGITGLTIERTTGNVHLSWTGTGDPVELLAVGGPSGELLDLSQLVTGDEAWIPLSALLVDDGSCLVVRPADESSSPVILEAAALTAQRAMSACVADAVELALPDTDTE